MRNEVNVTCISRLSIIILRRSVIRKMTFDNLFKFQNLLLKSYTDYYKVMIYQRISFLIIKESEITLQEK